MKKARFYTLVVAASILGSCGVAKQADSTVSTNQDHLLMAASYVQHAAEYRALCYQAYNAAMVQLSDPANLSIQNKAIVLDLDETVLDNSPYTGWQILNNQPYTSESWKEWSDLAKADTVPGVGMFLRAADQLGYKLFFVSNRKANELEATMANMKAFGLPQVEAEQILLRTDTSNKIPRRIQIERQGYQIVMLVGDNACDLDGRYEDASQEDRAAITASLHKEFGRRLIVLPNPIYGSWESALMEYQRGLSQQEKNQRLKSKLRSF